MLFTTLSEWIVLALVLLGGLLLGLALSPRGRKWQQRYVTERDAHALFRRDSETRLSGSEARLRELEAERSRHAQSEARIAELERENARLAQAGSGVVAPAVPMARRVSGERSKRNWFDWGPGSDPRAQPRV